MKDDVGPTDAPKTPSIDLREFKDAGYLLEVNRRFFHPLGLALSVKVAAGTVSLHSIWDGRDDPEGFVFDDLTIEDGERGAAISVELERRLRIREERLGFGIQPLPYRA
jgi:hypothetical protein